MRESVTYQEILEEGRAEGELKGRLIEARDIVLRRGRKRFGAPEQEIRSALDAISDINRLEQMIDRVEEVSNWQELLT